MDALDALAGGGSFGDVDAQVGGILSVGAMVMLGCLNEGAPVVLQVLQMMQGECCVKCNSNE